jgi:hypothetical protein
VTYLLRDIDPKLWKRFKARAQAEGRNLRFVLLALVQSYIDHGLPIQSEYKP